MKTTLNLVPVQTDCVILSLNFDDKTKLRFVEMGLMPQTTVRVIRRAPLFCPMEVSLFDCNLCLRVADAKRIVVTHNAD